jgi:hypothetical protein
MNDTRRYLSSVGYLERRPEALTRGKGVAKRR